MPRVAINRKSYMIKDFAEWIDGRMHTKGFNQKYMAKQLGITQSAFSNRINIKKYENGEIKDPFSYGDVLILFKILEATEEEKQRFTTL